MDANQHWNTYQILIAYLVDIFHWTLPKHLVASNVHSSCIFRHFSRRQFWICSDDLSFFTFVLATFCYHLFWYCQKSMANYVCRVSCTVYIPFYHVHSLRRYVQRKLHYFVYNFFDEFKVMKCLAWSSLKAMNKSFWFHSVRFPCEHFLNRWHKQWKQIENHKSTCQHELQKRNSIKKNRTIPRHIIWKPYTIYRQSQIECLSDNCKNETIRFVSNADYLHIATIFMLEVRRFACCRIWIV